MSNHDQATNAEPLLWQQSAHKKHPHKPTPPPPATNPYTLTQGNCANINSGGIPKNGNVVLSFPGCTTVTLYQAFNSPAAQAVWNTNQPSNPWLAPNPPVNPNNSSLMVIANAVGQVEVMTPFDMGMQFKISNTAITGGSEYMISGIDPRFKNPGTYMDLKSPDPSVNIPGVIFAGVAEACITPMQQSAGSVSKPLYAKDYVAQANMIRYAV